MSCRWRCDNPNATVSHRWLNNAVEILRFFKLNLFQLRDALLLVVLTKYMA